VDFVERRKTIKQRRLSAAKTQKNDGDAVKSGSNKRKTRPVRCIQNIQLAHQTISCVFPSKKMLKNPVFKKCLRHLESAIEADNKQQNNQMACIVVTKFHNLRKVRPSCDSNYPNHGN
jgi:hypothetical protein